MKINSQADVLQVLRALQRRLTASLVLESLATSALLVGAALLVFGTLHRFFLEGEPLPPPILVGAGGVVLILTIIDTVLRRRSLPEVAALIDRAGNTRDRVVSALAFTNESTPSAPMRAMAAQECRDFISRADFRPLIPVRPPRIGAWLVIPVVSLLMLQWEFGLIRRAQEAEASTAQAAVAGTIEEIEQLRKEIEQAGEKGANNELKSLADEMKQSAGRLRAETNSEDAKKAALRELSTLETIVKEMQRQPSPRDEMMELARALAPVPGMKDVLSSLDQNNLVAAAQALEKAQKDAGEDPPGADEEQTRESLRQAMERLAQQRQLSDALKKLFEQVQKPGGQSAMTAQAMQQLREMIQRMMRQADDGQSGGQQTQMTLQQLIAALQNMKFGDGKNQPPQSSGGPPGGEPQIAMQSFGPSGAQKNPPTGDAKDPTGRPGSEHDFGTTDNPFGGRTDPGEKGADGALKGQLNDGESLSMMMPAAGDGSTSSRRYQELYEAMAPAAESAVQQENIPLGSRFFIKRYFESIRPPE
ncbi:MAG: hypothetical protein ABI680_05315 [Chthoniobacteraceae bacterium]